MRGFFVAVLLGLAFTGASLVAAGRRPKDLDARFLGISALAIAVLWVSVVIMGVPASTAIAALGFAFAFPAIRRRAQRNRMLVTAAKGLADPARRADCVRTLAGVLWPPPANGKSNYAQWVTLVHGAAAAAVLEEMPHEALRLVELVDERKLDAASFVSGAILRALCALALGDRPRTRWELSRVTRPSAHEPSERSLVALEILLDAIDGDATSAAQRAQAAIDADPEARSRRTLRAAQAHAWVAMGRHDEALALLRDLVAEAEAEDPKFLARIVRHAGPASPLAASLLAADVAAYR